MSQYFFPEDPRRILEYLRSGKVMQALPQTDAERAQSAQNQLGNGRLAAMLARTPDPAAERAATEQRADSMWKRRIEGADPESIYTPEEAASDNRVASRKLLAGRNQNALEGRLPNYKPAGLTPDEQQRVFQTQLRDARGGVVDETSPLNQRGSAYALAAARDRSKALQEQQEQEAMSRRFRAVQATRAPDAEVESSKVISERRNVKTVAEKIAGVEDDPSTPMDESVRYRAIWTSPEGKERIKSKGLAGAKERRDARREGQEQQRAVVQSAIAAALAGEDAPEVEDPRLGAISQRIYGQKKQEMAQQSFDQKEAERQRLNAMLEQARMSDAIYGGNSFGQMLGMIQSQNELDAKKEEGKVYREHDLLKQKNQISAATQRSQAEIDAQKSLASDEANLRRELNQADLDARAKEKEIQGLIEERALYGELAAAGRGTPSGMQSKRRVEELTKRIESLRSPGTMTTSVLTGSKPSSVSTEPAVDTIEEDNRQNRVDAALAAEDTPEGWSRALLELIAAGDLTESQANALAAEYGIDTSKGLRSATRSIKSQVTGRAGPSSLYFN